MRFSLIFSTLMIFLLIACSPSEQELKIIRLKEEISNYDTIRSDTSLRQLYLRAVDHLIDQSINKVSTQKSYIQPFMDLIDSLKNEPKSLSEALQFQNYSIRNSYFLDIDSIDAKYISDNVYDVIYTLEKAGYRNDISEELLFEYVLPYRINREPLENWRKGAKDEILDSVYQYDNLLAASEFLSQKISTRKKSYKVTYQNIPDLPFSALQLLSTGRCKELTDYTSFVLRSYGIPVAHDFTPNFTNIHAGHDWNTLISEKSIPFIIPVKDKLGYYKADYQVLGKVYRQTSQPNPKSHVMMNGVNNSFRGFLNDPFIKDVTEEYVTTVDLEIPIKYGNTDKSKFSYLYVFNDRNWTPIAWGSNSYSDAHDAHFENVGVGGYYLPANDKIEAINAPFKILENGTIIFFEANEDSLINLNVIRKYPLFPKFEYMINRMTGGEFHGSNSVDFKNYTVLYKIDESPGPYFNSIDLNDAKEYKYVRYMGPVDSYANVAEIEFRNEKGKKLEGKIIASPGVNKEFPDRVKENVFDGDVVSIYQSPLRDFGWVGLAFKNREPISQIRFLARTDYNIIVPGDEYEIFYWNKEWVSLGRKVADSYVLVYPEAPSGALYRIMNHTSGKQERIFTYQDGEQIW